jgi:hypothetical protein
MFPFVTCGFTGVTRPGYFVCEHVLQGEAIADIESALDDKVGFACCAECAKDDSDRAAYSLCCADCAEMNFAQKVGSA